jgi:hypothetical protein
LRKASILPSDFGIWWMPLIKEILVIHECGVVLGAWKYTQSHSRGRDLIGGLISAIGAVGRETFHDDLKEIIFTNHKIVLRRVAWYCLVAIVDHEDDADKIGGLLTEISQRFESRYGHASSQLGANNRIGYTSFLESFDDLISPFMDLAMQPRKISNMNSRDWRDSAEGHLFVYENIPGESHTSARKKTPATDLSSE